jgi:hypothetical protein
MRGDLLWELVHTIMETEMSHKMPSASQRTREGSSVVQYTSKSPRTRGANVVTPSMR